MGDSLVYFETSNYGLSTCPSKEWRIVVECDKGYETAAPHRRVIPDYKDLKETDFSRRANLQDHEIIAVIMYTGPMVCILHFIL